MEEAFLKVEVFMNGIGTKIVRVPKIYGCGCWECGKCNGTGCAEPEDLDVSLKCEVCNGSGKAKLCAKHAKEA